MKKHLKNEKAITLIALVITIVVLIILAGVAISLTLGNNGLFNKAKEAKEKYINAQNYEEEQIAKQLNEIDNFVGSFRNNPSTTKGIEWNEGEFISAAGNNIIDVGFQPRHLFIYMKPNDNENLYYQFAYFGEEGNIMCWKNAVESLSEQAATEQVTITENGFIFREEEGWLDIGWKVYYIVVK